MLQELVHSHHEGNVWRTDLKFEGQKRESPAFKTALYDGRTLRQPQIGAERGVSAELFTAWIHVDLKDAEI